ncbi:Hypothetical predicted protein, partial [Pelobates cultripes]
MAAEHEDLAGTTPAIRASGGENNKKQEQSPPSPRYPHTQTPPTTRSSKQTPTRERKGPRADSNSEKVAGQKGGKK